MQLIAHMHLTFFINYSNLFPSTVLLTMDFKYPRFSICIQFCQVYYLLFMFPQFLFTQVKNLWLQHKEFHICRRHSCNGIQIFNKALILPTTVLTRNITSMVGEQLLYIYILIQNNCEISNVGNAM
jgi:hypothetical protein